MDRDNKKLMVNHAEAQVVQYIFRRFIQLGSAKKMGQELNEQGYRTKAWTMKKGKVRKGAEWNTGHVYRLLNNRVYIGEIVLKDESYTGEHEGIVDRGTWGKVQAILADNKPIKVSIARAKMVASLKGVTSDAGIATAQWDRPTPAKKTDNTPTTSAKRTQAGGKPLPTQTRAGRRHRTGGYRTAKRRFPDPDPGGQDLLCRSGN